MRIEIYLRLCLVWVLALLIFNPLPWQDWTGEVATKVSLSVCPSSELYGTNLPLAKGAVPGALLSLQGISLCQRLEQTSLHLQQRWQHIQGFFTLYALSYVFVFGYIWLVRKIRYYDGPWPSLLRAKTCRWGIKLSFLGVLGSFLYSQVSSVCWFYVFTLSLSLFHFGVYLEKPFNHLNLIRQGFK